MTIEIVIMDAGAKERGQPLEIEKARNRFTSRTSR